MLSGQEPKQGISGKIGATLILHTWTQQLTFHPHVHCIIPAGGINSLGQWTQATSKGEFLFHVRPMSTLFRGKLMAGIHQLFLDGKLNLNASMKRSYWKTKNKLYNIVWNTYAKIAIGGPNT